MRKSKTKTAAKPKAKAKAKAKKAKLAQSSVYSEASRMVELEAEQATTGLLKKGKGIVPVDALAGIRLFTPVQVWNGYITAPTEPTREVAVLASYLVRKGMRPEVACRTMGITTPEYSRWVEQGLRDIQGGLPETSFARFVRAIDMADAQDELADILKISSGENNWGAAAWKRERKNSSGWVKTGVPTTQVNIVSGTPDVSVETLIPGAAEVLYHLEQAGYLGVQLEAAAEETEG